MKISSFSGLAMLAAVVFGLNSNADSHIQKGDRLVFCGASNTGQHRYTQIVDTYLTCCRPDLEVTCSQAARSGESIDRFLGRMEETCIELFNPTVVTIDYNHNSTKRKDPSTKELEPVREMRDRFYRALRDAVSMFKGKGCRVVLCTASLLGDKWSNKEQNPRTEALIPVQKRVAEEMDCGIADFRGAMREAQERIRSTLFYLDTEVLTDEKRKAGITPQSIARDKDRTKRVLNLAQERVSQAHVGVEHSISITPR